MNILTKISVVVLLVVSLLCSVVIINNAVVGPNWRKAYDAETLKAAAAGAQTTSVQTELSATQNTLAQRDTELATARTTANSEIQKLTGEKQKLEADSNELKGQMSEFQAKLGSLDASVKQEQILRTAGDKELASTRKDLNDATKQAQALSLELQKKEVEIHGLTLADKANQTTIQSLTEQLKKIQELAEKGSSGTATETVATPTVDSGVKITGQVVAVDGDTVAINVGSAKGVKEGMQLVIYRKDKFVGHLRISEVQLSEAAGVIFDKQTGVDPAQGDSVTSSLK